MTEKSYKKPIVIVVAGALVDADGRVLITKRPKGKEMAGLWEFPGGKIEKGCAMAGPQQSYPEER